MRAICLSSTISSYSHHHIIEGAVVHTTICPYHISKLYQSLSLRLSTPKPSKLLAFFTKGLLTCGVPA